jgi:hypothetical protein
VSEYPVTKAAEVERMLADGWRVERDAGGRGYQLVKDREIRSVWNNAVLSLVRRGVIAEPARS